VLFGSYAKGTAKPGSDIDLLVVLDMEGDPRPYLARAKQLVERNFPRVDLILATRDEIEEQPPQRAAFLLSALETGITVFQRD
jgi:predicted nucleotidyltransferase